MNINYDELSQYWVILSPYGTDGVLRSLTEIIKANIVVNKCLFYQGTREILYIPAILITHHDGFET